MNPVERAVRKADAAQRRHTPAAFVVGVVKKYGDDHGGVLVANLAFSAFISLFPLLLILTTALGLTAALNPAFRNDALKAVGDQFPVIGQSLTGNVHELQRSSVIGLIVGVAGLIWGATGLAQAGLFTMEQVWNVPGPARPGYVQRLGRCVAFLGVLTVGLAVSTLLAGLVTYGQHALAFRVLAQALAVPANVGLFLASFRVLTPKGIPARDLVPGAVAAGIAWTVLQAFGTYIVHHYLHTASAYGIFATVLVLLGWIYLGIQVMVYAAEVNVVLTRHLWPRTIVQPPLAEADRASMALQALQNQRREEQKVEVSFTDRPPGAPAPERTPRRPEEVAPPARDDGKERRAG